MQDCQIRVHSYIYYIWHRKKIKEYDLVNKWNDTKTKAELDTKAKRISLNDFDRFKVMIFKRQVNYLNIYIYMYRNHS